MKLAINIDTSDKAARDQLIKMAITIYRFDQPSDQKVEEKMRELIFCILEGN